MFFKRRKRSRYKIESHPVLGFCALFDESPGPEFGHWWSPIRSDTTTGPHGDAVMSSVFKGDYWVATEEEAGDRVNRHSLRDGRSVVWEGG